MCFPVAIDSPFVKKKEKHVITTLECKKKKTVLYRESFIILNVSNSVQTQIISLQYFQYSLTSDACSCEFNIIKMFLLFVIALIERPHGRRCVFKTILNYFCLSCYT